MAKGQSAFKVSENFFKKFGAKAEQIAKEEARNMAIDMHFILKNRFPMEGGNGRWPRSDVVKGHSFRGWELKEHVNGEYWVKNTHNNDPESFNYTKILATGKGWHPNVLMGVWRNLTVGTKVNGVFSTQMPNGLSPWLDIKRGKLEENILARMKKEM